MVFSHVRPTRTAALVVCLVLWSVFGAPAWAIGAPANTPISNTATATFNDPDGQPRTVNSNTATLRVDEVLGAVVVSNDAGNVDVLSPDDDRPLSFTLTNPGNGSEAFALVPNASLGGDQYDPTDIRIYLDDGDGIFEPGQDTLYAPGVNDPVLAPDQSIVVFISGDTPAGRATGDTAAARLTATAVTGSGVPGTTFAGQGTGGVDAVVGATTATANTQGIYAVVQTLATLTKSQSIADPFGGSSPVPGAVITYTITMTLGGTGTITGAQIDDPIPANTTYVADSIVLDSTTALTDAADGDEGRFTGTGITVTLGSVTAPASHTVTFQVRIN
jgi:uncharacterized repeat protein (TIGR01451 family)